MKKPVPGPREKAEKQVLDFLERIGKGMSWESEIELYENIAEFCQEQLKELKSEDQRRSAVHDWRSRHLNEDNQLHGTVGTPHHGGSPCRHT